LICFQNGNTIIAREADGSVLKPDTPNRPAAPLSVPVYVGSPRKATKRCVCYSAAGDAEYEAINNLIDKLLDKGSD
jgi:hypothetical protein